ncbi:MAG: hypothetical protein ACJA08_000433 [Cyclobacteriaceae bacterium]|jgi:hypothetical protein
MVSSVNPIDISAFQFYTAVRMRVFRKNANASGNSKEMGIRDFFECLFSSIANKCMATYFHYLDLHVSISSIKTSIVRNDKSSDFSEPNSLTASSSSIISNISSNKEIGIITASCLLLSSDMFYKTDILQNPINTL